jgi:hypothetical protein
LPAKVASTAGLGLVPVATSEWNGEPVVLLTVADMQRGNLALHALNEIRRHLAAGARITADGGALGVLVPQKDGSMHGGLLVEYPRPNV